MNTVAFTKEPHHVLAAGEEGMKVVHLGDPLEQPYSPFDTYFGVCCLETRENLVVAATRGSSLFFGQLSFQSMEL